MKAQVEVPSPQQHFQMMKKGSIPFDLHITNETKNYRVHAVVVCALSPRLLELVTRMGSERKPIEFHYPDELDVFGQIMDFCYGFEFTITPANCDACYLIASDLRIEPLAELSAQCIEKSLTIATVVPGLLYFYHAGGPTKLHLRFIRENFYELMYNDDIMSLPPEILDEIMQSDEIAIDNEDLLAMWVAKVIQVRGSPCRGLVDRLFLGNISQQSLLELCAREEIEAHILLDRVRKEQQKPDAKMPKRQYRTVSKNVQELIEADNQLTVTLPEPKSVNGIISYIVAHQTPGISEIRVVVSSTHHEYFVPENLLKMDNYHRCWYSRESPEQWVMWDFSPRAMKPTCYTLRTSGCDKGEGHLRSWRLSASNDNRVWVLFDERWDVVELDGSYNAYTFTCNCDDFYRMFKITQIDVNCHKDYSFTLSCCEFFGQIVPKELL